VCVESLNVGMLSRCEVGEWGEWLEGSHQPCHFVIGAKQANHDLQINEVCCARREPTRDSSHGTER
jgi:hypothetical protein